MPKPSFETRVKMLWDSSHFYFLAYLEEDHINYIIQVNGKHRGTLQLEKDLSQEELEEMVAKKTQIKERYLKDPIKKVIYIRNKLINFVL